MRLTITNESQVRDEGTIIVVEATDEEGLHWWVAIDHRPAREIIRAVQSGEDVVEVEADDWQLMGRVH